MSGPKKDLSDEEKRALMKALERITPGELERARENLGDAAAYLEEMINDFPAARKFLWQHGAERVADLTAAQLKELEAFMTQEWFGKRPN